MPDPHHRTVLLPLTAAQRGVWTAELLEPDTAQYTCLSFVDLPAALDVAVLCLALETVVAETEALRTRFLMLDGRPVQEIAATGVAKLEVVDLRGSSDAESAAEQRMRSDAAVSLDLREDKLYDHTLLRLTDDRSWLCVRYHHIVLDGVGLHLHLQRLAEVYSALLAGEPAPSAPPSSVGKVVEEEVDYQASPRFERDRAFWADLVEGIEERAGVGHSEPGPAATAVRVSALMDADVVGRLNSVCRGRGVRWSVGAITAAAAFVHRVGGARDVVLGLPFPGRTRRAALCTPTMLANDLPLRLAVTPSSNFADLLGQTSDKIAAAMSHQRCRGEDVRRAGSHGLWAVVVNVVSFGRPLVFGAATGTPKLFAPGRVEDLVINIHGSPDMHEPVRIDMHGNAALYDEAALRVMHRRFLAFLTDVSANGAAPIGRIGLCSSDELAVLSDWNDSATPPVFAALPELFELQAVRTPDAIAIEAPGSDNRTYRELRAEVGALAADLTGRGIGVGDVVAIALPLGPDALVAMLAVQRSGAAYLPLDVDQPSRRLARILIDAGPVLTLTSDEVRNSLPDEVRTHVVAAVSIDQGPVPAPVSPRPSDAAYVIYTSGSTGTPKGVVVEHRSLSVFLGWLREAYPQLSGSSVAHTSIAYDLGVPSLFGPLTCGGRVRFGGIEASFGSPPTFMKATPSHLSLLQQLPSAATPTGVLMLGGEHLRGDMLAATRRTSPNLAIVNEYGPTEATVGATCLTLAPSAPDPVGRVPIGTPLPGTRIHVLDQALRPVPPGCPGEMYIAGALLARGYLRRPDRTAERFVADPFGAPGERMYRTGDLGQWDGGLLTCLGRADHQVKILGHRVELGEVEARLAEHPAVRAVAVVVREDRADQPRIVAYVVAQRNQNIVPVEMRRYLEDRLPTAMVPAATVVLDALPLTPNGKLDVRALPAPEYRATSVWRGPETALEKTLCQFYRDVLGVEAEIGIDDGFFELGGDSLQATRVAGLIRVELGVEVNGRTLFDTPTVAGLAGTLESRLRTEPTLVPVSTAPASRPPRLPLSRAQQGLWLLDRMSNAGAAYNVPIVLRFRGLLDHDALELAARDLVARHEVLRTVLPEDEYGPHQVVLDVGDTPLVQGGIDGPDVSEAISDGAGVAFQLATDRPLRLHLRRTGPDEHVLLMVAHHVACDGASLRPLLRDLGEAYVARSSGQEPSRASLPLQYADVALRQNAEPLELMERGLAYWEQRLDGAPRHLALPGARPVPAQRSHRGGVVPCVVPVELHRALDDLAAASGVTTFMVVHAALAATLHRLGAGTDISLGTVVRGRPTPDLEDMVGFFVNTLVLRVDLADGPSFRDLLARVRETDLDAFAHQDVPFEQVVERLAPRRSLGRNPLFEVMLSFRTDDPVEYLASFAGSPDLEVSIETLPTAVVKYDLAFELREVRGPGGLPGGLIGELEYSADRFDEETAELLVERLLQILQAGSDRPDTQVGQLAVLNIAEPAVLLTPPNGPIGEETAATEERGPWRAPQTPREVVLAQLIEGVLDTTGIGLDDDFFERGGQSLSAIRMLSQIRTALGAELSVAAFFEAPTIAGICAALDADVPARSRLIPADPRPTRVPLSFAQQRLWFLTHLDGLSASYTIPATIRLRGGLDRSAITAALADLVDRHEILRTIYVEDAVGAHQVVLPPGASPVPLPVVKVDEEGLAVELDRVADKEFLLTREIPLRARLFELGPDEHVLHVLLHHIAGDGWSMDRLAADLGLAYTARVRGGSPDWTPLPVQYADYTLWQLEVLGSEEDPASPIARQIAFWRKTLAGLPEELELPTDRPRPSVPSYRGGRVAFSIPAELHAGLLALGRDNKVSLFMTIHAALGTMLSRMGAGSDVPIGTPVAGRTDGALDDLVGFFVNTLVLRTDLSGDPTFAELLERVRRTDLDAYAHQDLPFERLVEQVAPVRSLARHPLFQVLLGIDDNQSALNHLRLPGLTTDLERTRGGRAKFDLSFFLDQEHDLHGSPAGLTGAVEYSTDLFDEATARSIARRLQQVLSAVVSDPEVRISRIPVLAAAERSTLLQWGADPRPVSVLTPAELVQAQVRRIPDEVAVICGDQQLTYRELDERANQLSWVLRRRGAQAERIVAIALRRSVHLPVALLAVAKSGAAALLLDPEAPTERLDAIIADSEARAVVTDLATESRLSASDIVFALDTQRMQVELAECDPRTAPPPTGTSQSSAYVVYTSGSTGTPKGVVMPRSGLVNLLVWHRETHRVLPGARVAQFLSLAFDFVVQEIWQTLAGGKTLMVPEDDVRRDLERFAMWVDHHAVTELFAPRLVIDSLFEAAATMGVSLGTVTDLFQGGEAFRLGADLRALCATPDGDNTRIRVHNIYGPAETHAATATTLAADSARWPGVAPIGRPIHNATVFVLDRAMGLVPPGVVGELHIGGAQLARGYLRQPGRTAERFVANPFDESGTRMYRTGDLVRWTLAGELEFVGRDDDQVKVRGFRVEPGEIEAALVDHPGVSAAAVLPRADTGETRLVAYVVPAPAGGEHAPVSHWREMASHLARRLPDYLVPSAFVLLHALPLTHNGKLDKSALPAPTVVANSNPEQPLTSAQALLCKVFATVLGLDSVGVDDGFFELGGDSIVSIQLVGAARREGLTFTVRDVFEHRTPAGLAEVARPASAEPAEEPGSGIGMVSLLPITRWLAERDLTAAEGSTLREFSMSTVLQVPADLGMDRLITSIQTLVDRHEVLRSTFGVGGSGSTAVDMWVHEVHPEGVVTAADLVQRVDAIGLDGDMLDEKVRHHGLAARGRLDLAGPMLQVVWFDRGPEIAGLLAVVIHHLVIDGVSWRVLVADLAETWRAAHADRPVELNPPTGTFRRWAQRLTANAPNLRGELPHWTNVLGRKDESIAHRGLDPVLDTYGRAGSLTARLPGAITHQVLTTVVQAFHAEINDVLLTAFSLAVRDWQARRRRSVSSGGLLIHLESHGREEGLFEGMDLSSTVGWFTTLYPVRLDPGPGSDPGVALKRVKDQLRSNPNRGIGYGLLRYIDVVGAAALAGLPHPQLAFNYLGRFEVGADVEFAPAGSVASLIPGEHPDMPLAHVLELNPRTEVGPTGPELVASWTWAGDLLTEVDVTALNDIWFAHLTALAELAARPDAGGMSTSDVSLDSISQTELDEFELFARDLKSEWENQL